MPWREGQAELVCRVACLNTKTVYPWTVTHLSTNPAWRRVTSLMRPTMLPPSETATATDLNFKKFLSNGYVKIFDIAIIRFFTLF